MLFNAGTLNNNMKTMQMQQKTTRRLNDVNMKKGNDERPVNPTKHLVEDLVKTDPASQQRQAITTRVELTSSKLKSGSPLTSDDLDFLRENAPELYNKALQVVAERKAYEERLNQCRTKEEVEAAKASRLQSFATEIQTVQRSNMEVGKKLEAIEVIGWKLFAVSDHHQKFIKTPQYAALPTEEEKRKGEKERDKKENPDDDTKLTVEELLSRLSDATRQAIDELKRSATGEKNDEQTPDAPAEDAPADVRPQAAAKPETAKGTKPETTAKASNPTGTAALPVPTPAPPTDAPVTPAPKPQIKLPSILRA